mmetsp:Transcript_73182/g.152751  ORF Transcript_73182/g.152751 Transcript_73182/m.152751 type:complete len:234 (+) Transcript_73182:1016-1717(+)
MRSRTERLVSSSSSGSAKSRKPRFQGWSTSSILDSWISYTSGFWSATTPNERPVPRPSRTPTWPPVAGRSMPITPPLLSKRRRMSRATGRKTTPSLRLFIRAPCGSSIRRVAGRMRPIGSSATCGSHTTAVFATSASRRTSASCSSTARSFLRPKSSRCPDRRRSGPSPFKVAPMPRRRWTRLSWPQKTKRSWRAGSTSWSRPSRSTSTSLSTSASEWPRQCRRSGWRCATEG